MTCPIARGPLLEQAARQEGGGAYRLNRAAG